MSKKIINIRNRIDEQIEKVKSYTEELKQQDEDFASEKVKITKYAYVCKQKTLERNIKKAEDDKTKLEKNLETQENMSVVSVDSIVSEKELPKTNVKTSNTIKQNPRNMINKKQDEQAISTVSAIDNFDVDVKTPTRKNESALNLTEPRAKNNEKIVTPAKNDPHPLLKKNMTNKYSLKKDVPKNVIEREPILKTPTKTPIGVKNNKNDQNKSANFDDTSTTPQALNKNRKNEVVSISPPAKEDNSKIMAIVNELKSNFEKRIKKIEGDNGFLKKKVDVFDSNKALDDEKIEDLEKQNLELKEAIKKLEISQKNSSKSPKVDTQEQKLNTFEKKHIAMEKKVDSMQDSLKFQQDTQNKKILSLESDFNVLQDYIQAENDKKSEIEERLNNIDAEMFEILVKVKEVQDTMLNLSNSNVINDKVRLSESDNTPSEAIPGFNAEQMLNAVVELKNNNDQLVQTFTKFEKDTQAHIIGIKEEVFESCKKIKAMMPLQFELVQKNSDLLAYNEKLNKKLIRLKENLAVQENEVMNTIVPDFNVKLRDLKHEISKNHDFLNHGLTTIELIYSDLSDNESLLNKYEPKKQEENEKFNQRLFSCDNKGQMKVLTYKGDNTSFEALVRPKDDHSKIIVSAKTHDNLNLFVGTSNGSLEQYSQHKPKQIKNHSQVLESEVSNIQVSFDNLSVFVADTQGSILKWSIPEQKEVKFQDRIHDCQIIKMALTPDNNYVITCDLKCGVKQFSVEEFDLVKFYESIFGLEQENGVSFFEITDDSQNLIVGDANRKQIYLISLENQKFEHDFCEDISEIHPDGVDCLCLVKNTMFLSSKNGVISEISLETRQVINNYTTLLEKGIYNIAPCIKRSLLFVTDNAGNLLEWSIESQKTTKSYGKVHSVQIDYMTLTVDGSYLITKDVDSGVKYWHIDSQSMGQNVGYPCDDSLISILSIKK